MTERIARYIKKFENADWKTMVCVAIFVPGVGVATFVAFCGLRAHNALRKTRAR